MLLTINNEYFKVNLYLFTHILTALIKNNNRDFKKLIYYILLHEHSD